ncbi:MAG TPA: hypothetical protein VHE35_11155 [Kofleriaceae bacterium]|nr:hypothetical protein [Kofleriaceae bacterium]
MRGSSSLTLALALGAAGLAGLGSAGSLRAASPATSAPGPVTDRFRLLRQISLDLYGRPPTIDEYEAVRGLADVDDAKLTSMLSTDEYYDGVREYHRALLWGGLAPDFEVVAGQRRLRRVAGGQPGAADDLWRQPNLRTLYRGRSNLDCLDQEQTEFDAAGRPVPLATFTDPSCRNSTCVQEGYVRVRPFWDPSTDYKVCAFDAQALTTGLLPNVHCGKLGGVNAAGNPVNDAGCGCGPNLAYCLPEPTNAADVAIRQALVDEPLHIFEEVVRSGAPYFDAFTTKTTYVNGPLAAFYQQLSGADIPLRAVGGVGYTSKVGALPDLPFADTTWHPVVRDDNHAGVLTTPGFMLRLATNRARVNRFYTAFRCEPFQPPAGGLPPDVGGVPEPNLRIRPGCSSCHATIELAAAYWGRWRTSSTYGYFDPAVLDLDQPLRECQTCTTNCSAFCNQYFVTEQTSTNADELATWRGFHRARIYLSEDEAQRMAVGPAGLVDEPAERDVVATCTVRTLAEHLFNRPLTDDEVLGWLPDMTAKFAASNHRFADLERDILESPTYRTLR